MQQTIKIKLTPESISEAIEQIESLQTKQKQLPDDICKKIAERTQQLAQQYFDEAWVNDMGRGERTEVNVTVTVEKTANGYKVVARGKEAVFVEFGAGVHFNGSAGTSPHPKGTELGFTIGDYGKHKGSNDSWRFRDEYGTHSTRGTEAQMPLYRAFMEAKSEVLR